MKCGLKKVRCPAEGFHRLQFAPALCPGGFSLIELLAVVAVLLILFVLLWGSRTSDDQQRQSQKECQTHLQKIYMAMEIYANENVGKFPVTPGARSSEEALDALVPRYTVDTAMFICPGSKDPPLPQGQSFRQLKISYAYYMGRSTREPGEVLMTDGQADTNSRKDGDCAFSTTGKPPGNNHGKLGGNALMCDGGVQAFPARVLWPLSSAQGVVLLNPRAR